MTEETGLNDSAMADAGHQLESPAVDNSTNTTQERSEYRNLSVDQINSITKDAHKRGYEKGKKELNISQPHHVGNANTNFNTDNTHQDIEKLVSDATKRSVDEILKQKETEQYVENIAKTFYDKITAPDNIDRYPDYKEQLSLVDFAKLPELVQHASGIDNMSSIFYELSKNPHKLAQLNALCKEQPKLAQKELFNLSNSIKQNEEALDRKQPNPPLSQIRNSPIGVNNGQDNSYASMKSRYKG